MLLAHASQVGEQSCIGAVAVVIQQAVQKGAHAQHTLAQLAQSEYEVDRDAVGIEVRVDRRCGMAAGFELVAELQHGRLSIPASQPGVVHCIQVCCQAVERAGLASRVAHAQPDFRRKPGRTDLAGAKRHGVQQRALPMGKTRAQRCIVALCRGAKQLRQALQGRGRQGGQPLGILGVVQYQTK